MLYIEGLGMRQNVFSLTDFICAKDRVHESVNSTVRVGAIVLLVKVLIVIATHQNEAREAKL